MLLFLVAIFQQTFMAGTFVFARYVLLQTDPFAVAFLRYTIAAAVLFTIASRLSKRPKAKAIEPADRKKIIVLGLVIIFFNQTLYLYGQKLTTAGHAALLFATTPIFVYLMAMNHLGEIWSWGKGIGIGLAVVGSAIIVFETGLSFDYDLLVGDMIIIVAVVAWAYYTVWGKPLVEKYGAFRITAYALASGAAMYFPFGLYRFVAADMSKVDTYGWLSILYIAIVTSVIGYSIWYWLLKHMEASTAAVLVNIQPIIAGILGFYLLSETISLPFVIGGVIILTGVTVTQQAGRWTKKGPHGMAGP